MHQFTKVMLAFWSYFLNTTKKLICKGLFTFMTLSDPIICGTCSQRHFVTIETAFVDMNSQFSVIQVYIMPNLISLRKFK